MRLAPLNWCKPSSKIFYWPFQGGTSFVDLLCFCSVLCLLCLCACLFIYALWSPAGKGLTSWLSFVVSTVSLSLSHWYPGSGVVLDCIDSWSLHPYLLWSQCNMFIMTYDNETSGQSPVPWIDLCFMYFLVLPTFPCILSLYSFVYLFRLSFRVQRGKSQMCALINFNMLTRKQSLTMMVVQIPTSSVL